MKQSIRMGLVVALLLGLVGSDATILTPRSVAAQGFGQGMADGDNYHLYDEQYRGLDEEGTFEDGDPLNDDGYDGDRGWEAQETRWWEEHPYYNEDAWSDPADWFDGHDYAFDEDAYQAYLRGAGYDEDEEGYEY